MNHYNDISNVVSNGIDIVWTYIVQLPGRPFPEKQEISISIKCSPDSQGEAESSDLRDYLFKPINGSWAGDAPIEISISYTELTWGLDLLAHIEVELKKYIRRSSKPYQVFRSILGMGVSFLTPAIVIFGPFLLYRFVQERKLTSIRDELYAKIQLMSESSEKIAAKIDYLLIDKVVKVNGFSAEYFVYLACFVLLIVSAFHFANRSPASFLLLNEASMKRRVRFLARRERWLYGGIVACLVGVAGSIAANHLGDLIARIVNGL